MDFCWDPGLSSKWKKVPSKITDWNTQNVLLISQSCFSDSSWDTSRSRGPAYVHEESVRPSKGKYSFLDQNRTKFREGQYLEPRWKDSFSSSTLVFRTVATSTHPPHLYVAPQAAGPRFFTRWSTTILLLNRDVSGEKRIKSSYLVFKFCYFWRTWTCQNLSSTLGSLPELLISLFYKNSLREQQNFFFIEILEEVSNPIDDRL